MIEMIISFALRMEMKMMMLLLLDNWQLMMMTITKQVNIQVLHELTGSDELYVDCQVEKDDENYYMNYYNYYTIII